MRTNKKSSAANQGKAAKQTIMSKTDFNISQTFNERKPLRRFSAYKCAPISEAKLCN